MTYPVRSKRWPEEVPVTSLTYYNMETHGQAQFSSMGHQGNGGARGKGFRNGAAARHPQSARVHTDFCVEGHIQN